MSGKLENCSEQSMSQQSLTFQLITLHNIFTVVCVFLANISQQHLCLKQLPGVEIYQASLKMKAAVLFIGALDF